MMVMVVVVVVVNKPTASIFQCLSTRLTRFY